MDGIDKKLRIGLGRMGVRLGSMDQRSRQGQVRVPRTFGARCFSWSRTHLGIFLSFLSSYFCVCAYSGIALIVHTGINPRSHPVIGVGVVQFEDRPETGNTEVWGGRVSAKSGLGLCRGERRGRIPDMPGIENDRKYSI